MAYILKNPTGPASEAAFDYATKLIAKVTANDPAIRIKMLTSLAGMNAGQVSATIDELKGRAKKAPAAAPADPAKQAVPGYYVIDGVKYQVKQSKLTKFSYVLKGGTYLGAKSPEAVAVLAEIVANGQAHAIAYAKITGKCGICNTKLTDPKSIAAGIGPHCAKKYK